MYNKNHNGWPGGNSQPRENAIDVFVRNHAFNKQWILSPADQTLVDYAEAAGKFMAEKKLTNSKIRSIYGEIKRIQMGTFEKEKSSFYLLKPKVAYAMGRDKDNEGLKLFKYVFDQCYSLVVDENTYKNFSHFMEAILAFHRANGGN